MLKNNLTTPKVLNLSASSKSEYKKIFQTLNEQSNHSPLSISSSVDKNKGKQDLKMYFDSLTNNNEKNDTIPIGQYAQEDTISNKSIYES